MGRGGEKGLFCSPLPFHIYRRVQAVLSTQLGSLRQTPQPQLSRLVASSGCSPHGSFPALSDDLVRFEPTNIFEGPLTPVPARCDVAVSGQLWLGCHLCVESSVSEYGAPPSLQLHNGR